MANSLNPVFLQRNFECREKESPGNPVVAAMRGITGPEKNGTITRQLYISSSPISARGMAITQGSGINAKTPYLSNILHRKFRQ